MAKVYERKGTDWCFDLGVLRWVSATGVSAPRPADVAVVGDELSASSALRAGDAGRHLLYRGHYVNVLQLLSAMRRRLQKAAGSMVHSHFPGDVYHCGRAAKRREHDQLSRVWVLLTGPAYRPLLEGAPALGDDDSLALERVTAGLRDGVPKCCLVFATLFYGRALDAGRHELVAGYRTWMNHAGVGPLAYVPCPRCIVERSFVRAEPAGEAVNRK
jgi:hypothetical protein